MAGVLGRRGAYAWVGAVGLSCVLVVALVVSRPVVVGPAEYSVQGGSPNIIHRMYALEEQQRSTRRLVEQLYCRIMKVLPSGGYCLDEKKIFSGGNDLWDGQLCAALEDVFGSASVADFGAGLGHYGRCLLRLEHNIITHDNRAEQNIMNSNYKTEMKRGDLVNKSQVVQSWNGYDGALNIEALSGGMIQVLDLSTRVNVGRHFDWVMSLEVGEHIPAKAEEAFLDNLVRHACKGVVLSWAIPSQGGHHHVNTQPNDYIKTKMAYRGLVADEEAEKKLRNQATVGWFKKSIMVFRTPKDEC